MYCISIREEDNSLPEGTATAAQQSRLPQGDRSGREAAASGLPPQACGWASRGTSDALPSGDGAEAPFGVVAVADQVL